ncbi:hypothetical protein AAHB66_08000 [Leclercia sp. S52]|uniref:hypothetical protein n=1 Tax=Leclercia sp. S52 TaxID=3138178 RepID=UPI00321AD00B
MKRKLSAVLIATALLSSTLAQAETFDLQKLIAAAKQEQPITVYASTGKIVQQAKAFSEQYGLQAVGVKADAPQIIEIMSREAQAKNVRADVAIVEDAPAGMTQLLKKRLCSELGAGRSERRHCRPLSGPPDRRAGPECVCL